MAEIKTMKNFSVGFVVLKITEELEKQTQKREYKGLEEYTVTSFNSLLLEHSAEIFKMAIAIFEDKYKFIYKVTLGEGEPSLHFSKPPDDTYRKYMCPEDSPFYDLYQLV